MKKNLIILALIFSFVLSASVEPSRFNKTIDSCLRYFATTNFVNQVAKNCRIQSNLVDACDNNKKLFTKAQSEIGISNDNLLPIKKLSLQESEEKKGFAYTDNNNIFVIEENFNKLPYGAKRITAFHEAYHHYFSDYIFLTLYRNKLIENVFNISAISSFFWLIKIFKTNNVLYKKVVYSLFGFFGTNIGYFLLLKSLGFTKFLYSDEFHKYKEFRADLEAVRKAQCTTCIEEYSTIMADNGSIYMNKKEAQYFIDLYKQNNCYCQHHKQDFD